MDEELAGLMGPQETPEELKGQWDQFLSSDQNRSALLQFGLALMQPVSPGQTGAGHIGQAIGAGAEASGRVEKQDIARELAEADARRAERKLDISATESAAGINNAEARLAEARAGREQTGRYQEGRLGLTREQIEAQKRAQEASEGFQSEKLEQSQKALTNEEKREARRAEQRDRELDIKDKVVTTKSAEKTTDEAKKDRLRKEKVQRKWESDYQKWLTGLAKARATERNKSITSMQNPISPDEILMEWNSDPAKRKQFKEIYGQPEPFPEVSAGNPPEESGAGKEGGGPVPPDGPEKGEKVVLSPDEKIASGFPNEKKSEKAKEEEAKIFPLWKDYAGQALKDSQGRTLGTAVEIVGKMAKRFPQSSPEDKVKIKSILTGIMRRVKDPDYFKKYVKSLGVDLNE